MVVILMKWVIYGNRENYGFQEKTEFQSNSKTLKPAFSKHPLLPLKVMMMMLMKSKNQHLKTSAIFKLLSDALLRGRAYLSSNYDYKQL